MTEAPVTEDIRACAECGARLDDLQEVCVECGHGTPLPRRRRFRGATRMAMLALFVVLLGASGAYGLGAGGSPNVRDLGPAPKNPGIPDAVAAAPKTPATASTTPDTVPQATATPPPSTGSTGTVKPSRGIAKPRRKQQVQPSTPSSSSSGGTPSANQNGGNTSAPPKKPPQLGPEPSWFDGDPPYSAFLFGHAHENASAALLAIDRNRKTAWVTSRSGVGLVVDTGAAQPYSAIAIATLTRGFTVSIYSSNHRSGSGSPAASGWKREAPATVVARHYQRIPLKGDQPRYLVIWIKRLPAGAPSASIAEVRLII